MVDAFTANGSGGGGDTASNIVRSNISGQLLEIHTSVGYASPGMNAFLGGSASGSLYIPLVD